jgi:hypothetical protein
VRPASGDVPRQEEEAVIMVVTGAERLDAVTIKASIGADEVSAALAAYRLFRFTGRGREIYFCEQPSPVDGLPLLDNAVVLRVRRHPGGPGDVTVKLRPCRPGQLNATWFAFRRSAHHELRIYGDWTGGRRVLAASLARAAPREQLREFLDSGPLDLGRLFSIRQRRYLSECAAAYVDLDDLRLLGPVKARRWRLREGRYEIAAERWTVSGDPSGLDFLELSVAVEPDDAALVQPAFLASIRRRGLDPYALQETKTRLVLQHLAATRPGLGRPPAGDDTPEQ